MALADFPREPLLFGPSPVHRLERLSAHLGGRRRDLGEARRLQLRPRVRRQQDAQARVPRRRRARAGLRHARVDRRRAVEPHAPGRRGRRASRLEVRARAGALGRVGRTRATRRSATSCCRGSWAPTCGSPTQASTSRSGRAGRRRSPPSTPRAASRTRFRPARPIIRSAVSASRAGPTRSQRRNASSASSSTRSSSARSPARRRRG